MPLRAYIFYIIKHQDKYIYGHESAQKLKKVAVGVVALVLHQTHNPPCLSMYLTLICINTQLKYLCRQTNSPWTHTIVWWHINRTDREHFIHGFEPQRHRWSSQLCIWFSGLGVCSFLWVCCLHTGEDVTMSLYTDLDLLVWMGSCDGPRFISAIMPYTFSPSPLFALCPSIS